MRRTIVLLLFTACAASKAQHVDRSSCEHQAESEYRMCTQPQYFAQGEPARLPNSAEIQACERSYHQSLRRCAGYEDRALPPIDLTKTSSS